MKECRCGSSVPDDRRTCPTCGAEVNPTASDPALQDQRRQGLVIAELRAANASLSEQLEQASQQRDTLSEEALALRTELDSLADEYRDVQAEVAVLKQMIRQLDERVRAMRSRFDAMDVPLFEPFEASQAPLFIQDRTGFSSKQRSS